MTKIKICGIFNLSDIKLINKYKPDFAGFIIFYPKSKRNISVNIAKQLLASLNPCIKSVAVTVSPSLEEVRLAKECGFDFIQIHGDSDDEVLNNPYLPVLRAFNVSDIDNFEKYKRCNNIAGYVFDAHKPGSGKTFDWSILSDIEFDDKLFMLAGGLDPNNVAEAIAAVRPDGVDVSSGVENESGVGKNGDKIERFISAVRSAEV